MTRSLRLAFFGSPPFAVPALAALHGAGHVIAAVYAQPPRPAGRGHRLRPAAVHAHAALLGLPVHTPARLRGDPAEWARFAALDLDAAVVAAYGLILPRPMLDAPRRGCLNIHASLLPRWRGAAPIHAAIRAGDAETGITIMQMEEGLDTGPTLLRAAIPIGPDDTTPLIGDRLAALGATLIVDALAHPRVPVTQGDGATYAPKLGRDDGLIDWREDAASIDRQVRAFAPWPGTFTTFPAPPPGGSPVRLKVLAATPAAAADLPPGTVAPGTVLDDALTVGCGAGALRLRRVQLPGGPPLDGARFRHGHAIAAGTVLGSAPPC